MLPTIQTPAAPGSAPDATPGPPMLSPSAATTSFGEHKDLRHSRQASSTSLGSASSSTSTGSKPTPIVPQRTPSGNSLSGSHINMSAHRQSFAEELRNGPSSPRRRNASVTSVAVQDLLNNPPPARHSSKFAGREWRDVHIGELTSPEDVKWATLDTSVEEATMLLLKSPTNVVLVRENESSKTAITTFDFSALNSYLLLVVGLSRPDEGQLELFNGIISKAQQGIDIPLREIQPICRQDTLVNVPSDGILAQAIEVLGSGIHRVLVTNSAGEVMGIVSQLRMVDFFWNEGLHFPSIDRLYPTILRDLGVGAQPIVSVNADAPLSEALTLMNNEGLTSVAVVDNGQNVVGNISTRDVRHLTSTASAPLLGSSCMHFISVILNERGVEKGRDAVPVFYVNPHSTLAHTVAKLVATRSHRMWVVESQSPSPSAPATPLLGPQSFSGGPPPPPAAQVPPSPVTAQGPMASVPASALAGFSGRLNGVISLTDVLNVFAKFSGLHPTDPNEERARRRRSSSSSMRPSFDSKRASIEIRR